MCVFFLQFSYSGSEGIPVHVVQLTFLQLLSATAKQTFTYHCLNSAAWLHTATHSHEHAVHFRGANGEELMHENTHYIRALYDGCQVSNSNIYIYLTAVAAILFVDTFIIWFFVVFLWCRHAQDKRGQCWKLMLLFPIPSLYLMLLCLILGRGTRNLVSKLAQSVSMVSQTERDYSRSNLVGKRAMDTFHLKGENTFRTYPVQKKHLFINWFTYNSWTFILYVTIFMQYILNTHRNVTVAVTQLQTFIFREKYCFFFLAFSYIWLFLSFSTINPQQFMSPQTLWPSKNTILHSAALFHQFVIIKPQFVVFFVSFFLVFFLIIVIIICCIMYIGV